MVLAKISKVTKHRLSINLYTYSLSTLPSPIHIWITTPTENSLYKYLTRTFGLQSINGFKAVQCNKMTVRVFV